MGTCFASSAYACSSPLTTSRAICVSIRPGFTALTRIPRLTYSSAAVRVRPTTPCLEAMSEALPGLPVNAGAVGGRGDPGHDPGVVERSVESPELGDGAVHDRGHLGVIAHIATDGECLVTAGDQLLRRRLHRVFLEVH